MMFSDYHPLILPCILTVQKLCDFNFFQGLALGLLDGFSIRRYEKKHDSFDLSAVWFESRGMRFCEEKSLQCWSR